MSSTENNLNVVIAGTGFRFPEGAGATARVLSFAKGLKRLGCDVHVLLPKPTETPLSNNDALAIEGTYQDIPFAYCCGTRIAAKSRLGALALYVKGLTNAGRRIRAINQRRKVDVIFMWGVEYPFNVCYFRRLAKSIDALLVGEACEFPFVNANSRAVNCRHWANDRLFFKMFDGIVAISSYLQEFYRSRLSPDAQIVRIPILVETEGYCSTSPRIDNFCRVAYCGNLDHPGEADDMIRAFASAARDLPQWRLDVVGFAANANRLNELKKLAVDSAVANRVTFHGLVPRHDIPAVLSACDIMALPRAAGVFSQAGMPTKLGEYLATGKPVVVTATGDISNYLQDGLNAFLVPPGSLQAFVDKLRFAMTHPDESHSIGAKGREVAFKEFDSTTNCRKFVAFVRSLQINAKPTFKAVPLDDSAST